MNTEKPDRHTIRQWMMAMIDGEASAEQTQEVNLWLAADPELKREFETMTHMRDMTMKQTLTEPGDELWESYWQGVYRRAERGLGWILFSLGAVVLMLAGAWEAGSEWITDDSIPVWMRAAGVCLVTGGIILLVSVIREKLYLHKNERYRDIQR
tara:strand:- start:74671 stop:75132 length:462 start_codon:yes stop_codon:yes gene_type:complete